MISKYRYVASDRIDIVDIRISVIGCYDTSYKDSVLRGKLTMTINPKTTSNAQGVRICKRDK